MRKKRPSASSDQASGGSLPLEDLETLLGADETDTDTPAPAPPSAIPGLLQCGAEMLQYLSELYQQREYHWIGSAFWQVVWSAVASLQQCLEDPKETEITWDDPSVEVQFPVDWNWDGDFSMPVSPQDETFMKSEAATEIAAAFVRHRNVVVLHFLTNRVAYRHDSNGETQLFPHDVLDLLAQRPPIDQAAMCDRLFQPVAVAANLIEIPQGKAEDAPHPDPIREALEHELRGLTQLLVRLASEPRMGSYALSLQFQPLVIDEIERNAYFPVVAGFVKPQKTEDDIPPPSAAIWERINRTLELGVEGRGGDLPDDPASADELAIFPASTFTRGTLQTTEDMLLRVVPSKTFPLPVGPALIDRGTHQVIATTIHTRGLFPRWSELPKLEESISEEARRIYEAEGIEGLRKRKGGLRRGMDGGEEPYLAADSRAVKDLMIHLGMTSAYRRQDRSAREVIASGGIREYACRIFQTPRGYLEIGLTWGHLAGPWVDEWQIELTRRVDAKRRQIDDLQADAAQALFEDIHEEEIARLQEVVDVASESIAIWKRGHTLMGLIHGAVYHQKTNWVAIPAEAIRMALWDVEGKEVPRNWKRDVDTVLASLASVSFTVRGLDGEKVKGFGHFLGEVWYEEHPVLVHRGDNAAPPTPPQQVPKGYYLLDVQPGFLGCLNVFQSEETSLNDVGSRLLFNWSKTLSTEEREVLTGKPASKGKPPQKAQPYLTFDPARYLAHGAKGLTASQRALDDCLERELTLNWQRSPGSKVKVALNQYGTKERVYTHEDCPLLPQGQDFVLAGGNGYRPGNGYTIGGSASPKKHSGWLAMVGYFSKSDTPRQQADSLRQFLDDVEELVEQFYGGVVAGYRQKEWIAFNKLKKLPRTQLMRAILRPFLPAQYRERRREAIRDQGIQVHETQEDLQQALSHQSPVDGAVIREARKRKKLTQKAFAEMFGVSQAMISQIETNKRPVPEEMEEQLLDWLEQQE